MICLSAVEALLAVKRSLIDPKVRLKNWNQGDPCIANWTGVVCSYFGGAVGKFRVTELYVFFSAISPSFIIIHLCSPRPKLKQLYFSILYFILLDLLQPAIGYEPIWKLSP